MNFIAAHFVYICQEVLDRAKLAEYFRAIPPTVEGYGVKYQSVYTPFTQLEGGPTRGIVLAEFENMERVLAWHHSEAYKKVRQLRLESSAD